jgi:glutathione synthase/RimK-type ligase-like ATP-grasp enzyme
VNPLVVVENVKRFPFHLEGVEVVSAKSYLIDPRFTDLKRAAVYNLCRSYSYQTLGYYVSLLAAARGHRPLPSVGTLQSLGENVLVKIVSDELEEMMQRGLSRLKSDDFRLSIYFGKNVSERYDRLARALFNEFPAPLLIARFARSRQNGNGASSWRLVSVRPLGTSEIPDAHRDFVLDQAKSYFLRPSRVREARSYRYEVAILWREGDENAPSDERAIRRFTRAFQKQGMDVEVVGPDDYARIAEFDGLFIRETTLVEHHTYRFARRALREGLVVLDHPEAIIRTNKVYQAELFECHNIPTPRTLVVHEGNVDDVVAAVGLPCVLKRPDGTFSQGVQKIESEVELRARLPGLFHESELVVAQEWAPSAFDWRVGVLARKPLWVCKYHMAPGHWQIVDNVGKRRRYGRVESVPIEDAPPGIVELALQAAWRIGDGLFGVDIKEVDGRLLVMEVNDNPNVEAGEEDALDKERIYDAVATWFRERLDARGLDARGANGAG